MNIKRNINKNTKKSLIFVCGLQTPKWAVELLWKKYLIKNFPNYSIHIIGDCRYKFEDIETMKQLIQEVETLINDSSSTILIGHSMGGILVSSLSKDVYNSNTIEKIITINTPHSMNIQREDILTINKIREKLQYSNNYDTYIPTLTFGGYLDTTVPKKYTKTPNSKHVNLWFEHYILFYISIFHIKKIIRLIKEL